MLETLLNFINGTFQQEYLQHNFSMISVILISMDKDRITESTIILNSAEIVYIRAKSKLAVAMLRLPAPT